MAVASLSVETVAARSGIRAPPSTRETLEDAIGPIADPRAPDDIARAKAEPTRGVPP